APAGARHLRAVDGRAPRVRALAAARPRRRGRHDHQRDRQRVHDRLRHPRLRRAHARRHPRGGAADRGVRARDRRRRADAPAAPGARADPGAPMSDALFLPRPDGTLLATDLTRGPWDPGAQHGGAPAALIGRAIERTGPGEGMRVARVTMELLRPVPIGPLRLETEVVRPGRRVQLVAARLWAGDTLTVQALALRIRR